MAAIVGAYRRPHRRGPVSSEAGDRALVLYSAGTSVRAQGLLFGQLNAASMRALDYTVPVVPRQDDDAAMVTAATATGQALIRIHERQAVHRRTLLFYARRASGAAAALLPGAAVIIFFFSPPPGSFTEQERERTRKK